MPNTIPVSTLLAKTGLAIIKNEMPFFRSLDRLAERQWQGSGFKHGDTLTIKTPDRPVATIGRVATADDFVQGTQTVSVIQAHVLKEFTSAELTNNLQSLEEVMQPVMNTLANRVDRYALETLTPRVYNAVGTMGTAISSQQTLIQGNARISWQGAPTRGRIAVLDPATDAAIANSQVAVFNQPNNSNETGSMTGGGMRYGAEIKMSQNVYRHTNPAYTGTPLVNGASQSGASLVTDGWGASITNVMTVGTKFTIAGVFAINLENRQSTGELQQFTVTAAANSDGSGNATLSISPPIFGPATPKTQTVSALPADNAAITVYGGASASGSQSLVYHPTAFLRVGLKLEEAYVAENLRSYETDDETGISMRVTMGNDLLNDLNRVRFDIFFGVAPGRIERACILQSN